MNTSNPNSAIGLATSATSAASTGHGFSGFQSHIIQSHSHQQQHHVSNNVLAHILLHTDLALKHETVNTRKADLLARVEQLEARVPRPDVAIESTLRTISEITKRMDSVEKDARPFVLAAERATDDALADDFCRRYYLQFGGTPQRAIQSGAHRTQLMVVYHNVSMLVLQAYARKISAMMASETPISYVPSNASSSTASGSSGSSNSAHDNNSKRQKTGDMKKEVSGAGNNNGIKKKSAIVRPKRGNNWCGRCNQARVVDGSSSAYVCTKCGGSVDYLDNDNKNWAFGKRIQLSKPLGYEHVNHFRKLLMHIQAKERYVVDRSVIDSLKREFASGVQLPNNAHINMETIKEKLSKLGQTDLYAHRAQIEHILTHRDPLVLTVQQERLLIKMFHQHRQAFEIYKAREEEKRMHVVGEKKVNRVNLLYYNYLLGKFAEILEDREKSRCRTNAPNIWTQVRMRVSRLKSQQCVQEHDYIHKNVCKILGPDWTFKESTSLGSIGTDHNLSRYTTLTTASTTQPSSTTQPTQPTQTSHVKEQNGQDLVKGESASNHSTSTAVPTNLSPTATPNANKGPTTFASKIAERLAQKRQQEALARIERERQVQAMMNAKPPEKKRSYASMSTSSDSEEEEEEI